MRRSKRRWRYEILGAAFGYRFYGCLVAATLPDRADAGAAALYPHHGADIFILRFAANFLRGVF